MRFAAAGRVALALAALVFVTGGSLRAETSVELGATAGADAAALFVATEEGFFKKRGLDASITMAAVSSTIPATLVADSMQIGMMTATTFLQAVDGGVDLVAVAGGSLMSHAVRNADVLASPASGIKTPQDFTGKKVATPGLGAYLHVIFRHWLRLKGVDPATVNFVEMPFPQLPDALKSGLVDAVIITDPLMGKAIAEKAGYVAADLIGDLPEGNPVVLYGATRKWAEAHPQEIAAYRAGIAEGVAFVDREPAKTRQDIAAYVKLPPEIIKTMMIGEQTASVTVAQLAWWVDVMKQQKMLQNDIDPAKLILP